MSIGNDYLYRRHVDLTNDVGATVTVHLNGGLIWLSAGGDLSISVCMDAKGAHLLGAALIGAAEKEQAK